MASGNYLALKVSDVFPDDATVQAKIEPGNMGYVTLDSDRNVVFRVASNEQKIYFKVSDPEQGTVEYVYNLDLTLTPAETDEEAEE